MGVGASSRVDNKPEVHVVVVQQRPTEENSSSTNAVDNSNVDSEIIQTALKAAKLNTTNESRYMTHITDRAFVYATNIHAKYYFISHIPNY